MFWGVSVFWCVKFYFLCLFFVDVIKNDMCFLFIMIIVMVLVIMVFIFVCECLCGFFNILDEVFKEKIDEFKRILIVDVKMML